MFLLLLLLLLLLFSVVVAAAAAAFSIAAVAEVAIASAAALVFVSCSAATATAAFSVSLAPLLRSGLFCLLHAAKLAPPPNVGGVAHLLAWFLLLLVCPLFSSLLRLPLRLGCRHNEVFRRVLLLLQRHINLEVKHCTSQAVANAAYCQAVAKVANAACCHLFYHVCLYSHSVSQHLKQLYSKKLLNTAMCAKYLPHVSALV